VAARRAARSASAPDPASAPAAVVVGARRATPAPATSVAVSDRRAAPAPVASRAARDAGATAAIAAQTAAVAQAAAGSATAWAPRVAVLVGPEAGTAAASGGHPHPAADVAEPEKAAAEPAAVVAR